MAAVDQDRELYGSGAAEITQGVERGPHGSPGEQHVVDQYHECVVDTARRHRRAFERTVRLVPQIVAVEGDVEGPERRTHAREGLDTFDESFRQRGPASGNAE